MNPIQLFLVRIWQEQREFRASVRPVDERDAMLFTEPAEMLEFLRTACEEELGARSDAENDAGP
jgi:predicted component of type VI protein secretion system